MQIPIVYEDRNFLAINKPAGLVVHGYRVSGIGSNGETRMAKPEHTLVDWLIERYPGITTVGDDPAERPGIVHRLDKATSGIMLVAKNQKTFEYLKSLFQKREVRKTYLALVRGVPKTKSGIIDAPIGIRNGTTKRSVRSAKMAKEAITEWKVLKSGSRKLENGMNSAVSLLEIRPKTGRTHQIRVHLASIGHPVIGDKLYGGKLDASAAGFYSPRLMLHALSVEFTAPDGKRMKLEAEIPEVFHISDLGSGSE
ncbi:MAG: RluA family pseudouridine synthase [Patescibacteria group bacterium]|nr:RluA family pseudouridine synthase [Patescibacteria group bacterium]